MSKIVTNRFIQEQIAGSGELVKSCWSLLWQNGEVFVSDMRDKGYSESLVRQAYLKFVKNGWAVKPKGTKNYWKVSKNVVKG